MEEDEIEVCVGHIVLPNVTSSINSNVGDCSECFPCENNRDCHAYSPVAINKRNIQPREKRTISPSSENCGTVQEYIPDMPPRHEKYFLERQATLEQE